MGPDELSAKLLLEVQKFSSFLWNFRSSGANVPRTGAKVPTSECSMERKFHGSESSLYAVTMPPKKFVGIIRRFAKPPTDVTYCIPHSHIVYKMAEVQEPYEGQLFNSYEEFNDIQQYCRATAQTFVTDDSKKVERANEKLAPDNQFPTSLRYSYLNLTCVKFGDKHTKKCRPLSTLVSWKRIFAGFLRRSWIQGWPWEILDF